MEYQKLYQDLTRHVLKGKGESTPQLRQAAFDNTGLPASLNALIDKVAHQPYKVTDNDIAAVKATGITEDQLFELVICGAVGQASRQYQSGLTALAEAIQEGGRHAS